jgi:hypothetical protein
LTEATKPPAIHPPPLEPPVMSQSMPIVGGLADVSSRRPAAGGEQRARGPRAAGRAAVGARRDERPVGVELVRAVVDAMAGGPDHLLLPLSSAVPEHM